MTADIAAAVAHYLGVRRWPFEDRGDVLVTPVLGEHGSWSALFEVRQEDAQLLVYSLVPVDVPAERRTAVALYLTRANFGLSIGNFELDLDDGEVRFKTSLDVEGADTFEPLIDHLFLANVATADYYIDGLRAVVDGDDPAEAIVSAEGGETVP